MPRTHISQRILLLTGVMLCVAIVIGVFIIAPSVRRTKELRQHVQQTQQALETDYQKTIQLRRSVRELENTYKNALFYNKSTIRAGDELLVITELESLTARLGIEQTLHVSFTDPAAVPAAERKNLPSKTGLPFYTFSFLNHGTFDEQMQFLTALQQLPYYMIIDSMQWEQRGGDASLVTVRFDARVYTEEM